MPGTVPPATWTADMKSMSMNCPETADGNTTPLTVPISGYLIMWVLTGDPIITAAGYIIPIMGMYGRRLIPGDSLLITTADGIGIHIIAGIGFPAITGLRHGCPGIGMIITMAGAPLAGGTGR